MVEKVQPTGVLPGEGFTVGVLALQGGVSEHAEMLESLGAQVRWVRTGEQLEGLDALVLPGGESSTIDRLTRIFGVREPLIEAISSGLPTLGTCAGLIMLSERIDDPAPVSSRWVFWMFRWVVTLLVRRLILRRCACRG